MEPQLVDNSVPTAGALPFPGEGAAKSDVFGRALAGIASPYQADPNIANQEVLLQNSMQSRRQMAWDVIMRVLDPVPLLGLADQANSNEAIVLPEGEVPYVPRWQTWYGVDDFKRMFRHLYGGLTPEERAERAPFAAESLTKAEEWNANALDRSERWPLERFLRYVNELGVCPIGTEPDDCAKTLQSKFSGAAAGNARISYSPGTMRHLLGNYGSMLDCMESLETTGLDAVPANDQTNFSACFDAEFPSDAVLIKTHWIRSDFGRKVPVYDTSAEALATILSPTKTGDWGDGQREADPSPGEIYTIQLRNGDRYRLAGLHIMTKELRHWVWITMWWSDQPNTDFGADRPAAFANKVAPIWSHYKMGVVVDYKEHDLYPAAGFEDTPTLAAALSTVKSDLSWLSNPYIEHGRGNAKTNCVGCHQHGGSVVGPDLNGDNTPDPFDLEMVIDNEFLYPSNGRSQIRSLFPSDYLWSTARVDNLRQVIRNEVELYDFAEKTLPEVRAAHVLQMMGNGADGEKLFDSNCTTCHGSNGQGLTGPSLYERVPTLTDHALAQRLITGKPPTPMPSWSQLANQQLADLVNFLRTTFGGN